MSQPSDAEITLQTVTSEQDIVRLAELAGRIWREHYTPLIGSAQVKYMLDKFQSPAAIREQIATQGYVYRWLLFGDQPVGYYGIQPQGERLYLSKYYLQSEARGSGWGRLMMNEIEESSECFTAIYLNVNKGNSNSIAIYQRLGFVVMDSIRSDIGHGFFMDDYVMEKRWRRSAAATAEGTGYED